MTPVASNVGVNAPLRQSLEQRLSQPRYDELWATVAQAFAGDTVEEQEYWEYALGLPDAWRAMSRAPTGAALDTVVEIADLAEALANKIAAHSPELETIKGYLEVDKHTFMLDDLRVFAADLREPSAPTEAVQVRPRGMANASAERTYAARALTRFLLEGEHKPMARMVALTVCALLDLNQENELDEKQVRDVTEDICKRFRVPKPDRR
mgnify:CR=1 FL=1